MDPNACRDTESRCGSTCVDTKTSNANCGGCGKACAGGEVCSNGACALSCAAGLLECGGDGGPAYCANGATDNANCGACGTACGAGTQCVAGKCALSCQAGLTTCTVGTADGGTTEMCTNLQEDNLHCGKCETACSAGQACVAGACVTGCKAGLVYCGDRCVDPQSDSTYCGASDGCGVGGAGSAGTTCAAGKVCSKGACAPSCGAGTIECGGACIDPLTSTAFCGASAGCGVGDAGAAGKACATGEACYEGVCSKVTLGPPSANLLFWLKADAITGVADGGAVATWTDSSGNARDAAQGTAANQPTLKTNQLNGLPVVRFNPASSFMVTPSFPLFGTSSQPLTIFAVFKANTVNAQRFLLQQPEANCSTNLELGYDTGTQTPLGNFGVHAGCSVAAVTSTAITAGKWYVAVTEIAGTGTKPSNVSFRMNGVAQTTTAAAGGWVAPGSYGTTSRKLVISGRDDRNDGGYNSFHDGDIAEIIIYSNVDAAMRDSVEKYLRGKWGI